MTIDTSGFFNIRRLKGILHSHLVALVLIGIYISIAGYYSFKFHLIGDYGVETDFYWDYAPAAGDILEGTFNLAHYNFRGPGYPLLLSLFIPLFSDAFTAAKVLGLLAAGIALWFIYRLFLTCFNKQWAVWSIFFLALNPVFFEYSIRVGTDLPFVSICLVFYFLLVSKRFKGKILLTGALAGLAYLTRYNGIALLIGGVAWITLKPPNEKSGRMLSVIVFTAGFLAVVSPWWAILLVKTGNPFFNLNMSNIAYSIFGEGKFRWDDFWYSQSGDLIPDLFDMVIKNPVQVAAWYLSNLFRHFRLDIADLIGLEIGWLVVAGMVWIIFKGTLNNPVGAVLTAGSVIFIVTGLVFYSLRFSLPLIPVYGALAVSFLSSGEMARAPAWWKSKVSLPVVIGFLLLLVGIQGRFDDLRANLSEGPVHIYTLTRKKAVSDLPPGKMAARKPHAPYHLGHEFVVIPKVDSLDELVEWMQEKQVKYLFLNRYEALFRPQLYILLSKPEAHPMLRPVYLQLDVPEHGVWMLIE